MLRVEHEALDCVILGDEHQQIVEMDEIGRVVDATEVPPESCLRGCPVRHRVVVLVAARFRLQARPVAIAVGVAGQVERLRIALSGRGVVHELGHSPRVPNPVRLDGRQVVGHTVLGLAGRERLDEGGAPIIERLEDGPVELGRVRHRHLCHVGRAMAAEEGLGNALLLRELALGGDAELIHVAAAQHRRGIRVLPPGVRVHLGIEHEQLHVRSVLQHDLRDVLVADVAHAAVTTDRPGLGKLTHLFGGEGRVGHVRHLEVVGVGDDVLRTIEKAIDEPLGHDRPLRMVHDETLTDQPGHGGAVLEQRVHPWVRMRVVRRCRAVDGVAPGVRTHRHRSHPVRQGSLDGLEIPVVERILAHRDGQSRADLGVGDVAVRLDPGGRVVVGFAAEPQDHMSDRPPKQCVLGGTALLQRFQPGISLMVETVRLLLEALGFGVEQRTHVGLGEARHRVEDRFLTAAGTRSVAGHQRFVVASHHQVVLEVGDVGADRVVGIEPPQVLAGGVGEEVEEIGAADVVGVQLCGLLSHLERFVGAFHHTLGAPLAQIRDHDGEQSACALFFPLQRPEDGGGLVEGEGNPLKELHELVASQVVDPGEIAHLRSDQVGEGGAALVGHLVGHRGPEPFFDAGKLSQQQPALADVGDVCLRRGLENSRHVLGGVGQRGVGTGGDAVHTRGAILGDPHRGFPTGDVLRCRPSRGRGHHPDRSERRSGLVVSETRTELLVEGRQLRQRDADALGRFGRPHRQFRRARAAGHERRLAHR